MNGTPFLAIRWSDPGSFKANGVRKGYRGTFVHPFSQKGCTGNSKSKNGTPNWLFSRVCKDKNEKMVYESGKIPYPYTREYKGAKMVAKMLSKMLSKMLYRLSVIARAGRAPVHGRGLLSRSPTPYNASFGFTRLCRKEGSIDLRRLCSSDKCCAGGLSSGLRRQRGALGADRIYH